MCDARWNSVGPLAGRRSHSGTKTDSECGGRCSRHAKRCGVSMCHLWAHPATPQQCTRQAGEACPCARRCAVAPAAGRTVRECGISLHLSPAARRQDATPPARTSRGSALGRAAPWPPRRWRGAGQALRTRPPPASARAPTASPSGSAASSARAPQPSLAAPPPPPRRARAQQRTRPRHGQRRPPPPSWRPGRCPTAALRRLVEAAAGGGAAAPRIRRRRRRLLQDRAPVP